MWVFYLIGFFIVIGILSWLWEKLKEYFSRVPIKVRALEAFDKAKYQEAIELYSEIILKSPQDLEALYFRAASYYGRRTYKLAHQDLSTIEESTQLDANCYALRGKINYKQNSIKEALVDFDQAIFDKAPDPELLHFRALCHSALGNTKKAINDLSTFITLRPDSSSAYSLRGNQYCLIDNWVSAISDYTKAFELKPKKIVYIINRGTAYYKNNQRDKAKQDWIAAARLDDSGEAEKKLEKYFKIGVLSSDGVETTINLTKEFTTSIDKLLNTDHSVFITGKAGTGKSTLLKYFKSRTNKRVAVIAPTGIAAINVGGATIHSFFRFGIGFMDRKKVKGDPRNQLYTKLDVLVIDEVSMVRADLMDAVDISLKKSRKSKAPFGGVQMVFIGDLFQLPPVLTNSELEIYNASYSTPYFFSAKAFINQKFDLVDLQDIHRQDDQTFKDILNRIRVNEATMEDLTKLNQQVDENMDMDDLENLTTLSPTNRKAKTINEHFLNKLNHKPFSFHAKITGRFTESQFPASAELILKDGARIMMIKNDRDKRWVNGQTGKVSSLSSRAIFVTLGSEEFEVSRETWEKVKYKWNEEDEKFEQVVTGSFEQFPIKLAWAITIHKSQGQTLDETMIDFDSGTFAHGQAYVALSRCRTLEGIRLARNIQKTDIKLDDRVYQFNNYFQ